MRRPSGRNCTAQAPSCDWVLRDRFNAALAALKPAERCDRNVVDYIAQARQVIRRSFAVEQYRPRDAAAWDEARVPQFVS